MLLVYGLLETQSRSIYESNAMDESTSSLALFIQSACFFRDKPHMHFMQGKGSMNVWFVANNQGR